MKPFMLQIDGDLWEVFWDTIVMKKPNAVDFTKVKGHATDDQVQQGKVKAEDTVGNDQADCAADKGFELHNDSTRMSANLLAQRQTRYECFITDIHNHIIEAILLKQKILDEREKAKLGSQGRVGSELDKVEHLKKTYKKSELADTWPIKPGFIGDLGRWSVPRSFKVPKSHCLNCQRFRTSWLSSPLPKQKKGKEALPILSCILFQNAGKQMCLRKKGSTRQKPRRAWGSKLKPLPSM